MRESQTREADLQSHPTPARVSQCSNCPSPEIGKPSGGSHNNSLEGVRVCRAASRYWHPLSIPRFGGWAPQRRTGGAVPLRTAGTRWRRRGRVHSTWQRPNVQGCERADGRQGGGRYSANVPAATTGIRRGQESKVGTYRCTLYPLPCRLAHHPSPQPASSPRQGFIAPLPSLLEQASHLLACLR